MAEPGGGRHQPVLLREALESLRVRPDGCYVDCTFGRGGHARAILARLGPQGRLYALDRDPEAVAEAQRLQEQDPRLVAVHAPFGTLGEQARRWGVHGRLDGVLLDLGVSSPQLDDPRRGFGFRAHGPLDMRMDPGSDISAARWLATVEPAELARVLRLYGEEPRAGRIARAIVRARARAPITTTTRLAEIVAEAAGYRGGRRHPATRTFQAIRIHVNRELDELAAALGHAAQVLAPGGRLVVISFHSLEDRIVKRFLRGGGAGGPPRRLPVTGQAASGPLRPVGGVVRPGPEECARNPRARSARLRVAERRP